MDKSIDDLSNWSVEMLSSEYHSLYKLYNELKLSDQRQLQEIHQLRRGTSTDNYYNILTVLYHPNPC